jgi:hypothetical protein
MNDRRARAAQRRAERVHLREQAAGEPVLRRVDGGEVPRREDRGRDEPAGAEAGAQDAPARRPLIVQAGLEVPPVERLLWKRDDEELAEHLVGGVDRLDRQREVR